MRASPNGARCPERALRGRIISVNDTARLHLSGNNETPVWGMSNAERVHRLFRQETAKRPVADGHMLHVNLDYAFDPLLMRLALKMPGVSFTNGSDLVVGQWRDTPERTIDLADKPGFYNDQLRKTETPFAMRLTPQTRYRIERASYFGAYKGITDILTKYLWPELAFHLTRLAARLRMTPNMVTGIGAALCVVATILFAQGQFWTGMLAGFIFMVLDTVDGKLARCTITSSWWGNIFDHGIDLVHPPFWWIAWAIGTATTAHPLTGELLILTLAAILGGYIVQRIIEGLFIRNFGFHIHVWRKIDSDFRLITARRNPNMVLLFISLLAGRPDLGLVAVAWWTIISLLVHTLQIVQAYLVKARGNVPASWLEQGA